MKLTKQLEKQIRKVYDDYWNSYLAGDMKHFASLLDEHCHIIGSTAFDIFNDRQSAVAFYTATAEQVSGKAEFRNRNIILLPAGDNVMVQEQCDFYFLTDGDWHFYGHTRLSSLLAKKETGWKIIHQHGSLPDTRAQEGEQLGLEKITKENFELRDAVKRHTVELQNKNRELEIEMALEKVRAVALAMILPTDLLSICQVLFEALHSLGFSECRNTMINIHYDEKNYLLNYDYAVATAGTVTNVPYNFHPVVDRQMKVTRNVPDAFYEFSLAGEELKEFRELRKNNGEQDDPRLDITGTLHYYFYSIGTGSIGISTYNSIAGEKLELLKRFRNVFNLSYRRYTDIALAGEQAREAKIELALERVRARTMAMQKSEELPEAANLLFQQMQVLDMPAWSAGYCTWDEDKQGITLWMSSEGVMQQPFHAPLTKDPSFVHMREAYERNENFHVEAVGSEALVSHYKYMRTLPGMGEILDSIIAAGHPLPSFQIFHCAYFLHGFLLFITYKPVTAAYDIFKRFAKVFEQTYTRFLDLQKAEAQARESQIQLALERARAQSMMMQHSGELDNTLRVFHEQVQVLGIPSAFSFLWLPDENSDRHIFWAAWSEEKAGVFNSKAIDYPLDRSEPATAQCLVDWKGADPVVSYHVLPSSVNDYFVAWNELIAGVEELAPENFSNGLYYVEAFMKYGCFGIITSMDLSPEEKKILDRFAKEFEQTYTRFLDLQKAEIQASEAQIELSLERVRAKTMGMHNSNDVGETAAVLVDELKKLGIETIRCGIGIMHEPGGMELWTIRTNDNDKSDIIIGWIDMNIHPLLHGAFESWRNKNEFFYYELKDEDLLSYFTAVNNYPGYPIRYDISTLPGHIHHNEFYFPEGILFAFSLQQLSDDQRKIFKRFAGVFGQTYRRYLDLKKAEAQARQAMIEAAMEKVRSRAMAMQKPDELVEVAEVLRKEMGLLGVEELETSSIYIHHEDTKQTECWYAIKDVQHAEKALVSDHMTIDLNETSVGKQMLQFYHSGKKEISISMQGADRKEWINYCAGHSDVLVGFYGDTIPDRTYHLYKFLNGYMGAASPGDISAESWDLLQRATAVFSLAYTRFSDLQQAAIQAREAKIETALERVRSRTLAMQKSDELAETAAVLFRQLIHLGIAPHRLYIGIIKDETGDCEFWVTCEDGNKISTAFKTNLHDNPSFFKMLEGWKGNKKSIGIDMHGQELEAYLQHLVKLGVPFQDGLMQKRRLQHIAYFGKGFIGMASSEEQAETAIGLLERFAAVFNLTFTRFNDLQVAEAHAVQAGEDLIKLQTEKKRAEDALTELRETQKQLIQSEKMASLGELTAGIAHEIQNPLNFVNNFSEVNKELLQELKEAVEKGNMDEVKAITNDVIGNEEKIIQHGKRADAIVKGMLQHSRKSEGVKEPADINALCDEYFRLSYHGLRAKDKSFNVAMKTDFDNSIEKIVIVPQDMGRVVLNIMTNAFYAVNDRKKMNIAGYEPTVSVQTKHGNDKIELRITDNGGGIPQNIIDKIFQPFFTTKPTGQGTGLGLSLAYDIVKAHGGTLKAATKAGEGSTFIIQLPMK